MAKLPWYIKITDQKMEGANVVFSVRISKWGVPALLIRKLKQHKIPWRYWPVFFVRYYFGKVRTKHESQH